MDTICKYQCLFIKQLNIRNSCRKMFRNHRHAQFKASLVHSQRKALRWAWAAQPWCYYNNKDVLFADNASSTVIKLVELTEGIDDKSRNWSITMCKFARTIVFREEIALLVFITLWTRARLFSHDVTMDGHPDHFQIKKSLSSRFHNHQESR